MRADLPIAVLVLAASALPASAQAPSRSAESTPARTGVAAAAPVIACASLANLRTVLRGANDDSTAAVPVINDPKSDLGCNVLDQKTVTGIADHVALNGRSYECLSLQSTSVCQWTVAGSVTPAASQGAGRPAPSSPAQGKTKR